MQRNFNFFLKKKFRSIKISKKYHIFVFITCFCLALSIGALNSNTKSISEIFSIKTDMIAVVIYTLLLVGVFYTFLWFYLLSKKNYD